MPAARRLEAVCCQLSAPAQPPTAWAATAAPATAAATTAAEQPSTPGALSGLSPEQEAHYHDQGYLVLRGIVSERDLVQLERPMYAAFESGEDCGVDSQPGSEYGWGDIAVDRAQSQCVLRTRPPLRT